MKSFPFFKKNVKGYLRSTMGNNRLHALTLMHFHKNILNNITLADVAKYVTDRKDSRKQKFVNS